jgi:hypothetical protein
MLHKEVYPMVAPALGFVLIVIRFPLSSVLTVKYINI